MKEVKLEQAVLKVKADTVHIFLGIEALSVDDEHPTAEKANTTGK